MKKTNLLYHTFDGKMKEATIQRAGEGGRCSFLLEMLEGGGSKMLELTFHEVAALEYSVNFMDAASETKCGFYKVPGKKQKRKLLERNCKRRKKEWIMTRLRDAEKAEEEIDPADQQELDMLEKQLQEENLYLLETRRGAWLVLAKSYECVGMEDDG